MRIFSLVLLLLAGVAVADPMPRVIETIPAQPPAPVQLEWNNNRPEQREALDHFYRSLQAQQQQQDMMLQRLQRQQHVDQLRGMSPEQRQQQFLNFIQQQQNLPVPAAR